MQYYLHFSRSGDLTPAGNVVDTAEDFVAIRVD